MAADCARHGRAALMQIIDAAATARALPFDRLIAALRDLFIEGCEAPSRHVHRWASGPEAGAPPVSSLIMPAWQTPLARNPAADGLRPAYFGVKIINIAPGNATLGLPGLHAIYLLHDAATGVPLALIDGDVLTARRTAATSALAASFLTPEQALHLLVVGAGRIAQLLPFSFGPEYLPK